MGEDLNPDVSDFLECFIKCSVSGLVSYTIRKFLDCCFTTILLSPVYPPDHFISIHSIFVFLFFFFWWGGGGGTFKGGKLHPPLICDQKHISFY